MAYSYTLTPKDIYGVEEPTIPKGYKVVGFRPVRNGDDFLATGGNPSQVYNFAKCNPGPAFPRFILEKLPERRLITREIDTCWHCCYAKISAGESRYRCTKSESQPVIEGLKYQTVYIPEWCPLPKAS